MDKCDTHSLEHVGRGVSFGLPTLQLTNITTIFLPPNVTSVLQPLDQGIIASFNVQFKNNLLEWILYEFDSFTTHHDLRNIMPNVKASYYAMLSSVERDEFANHMR